MCLCLKYIVRPFIWRAELGVWEVVLFPVPGKIVYSFFNFLFDIFWNSINLAYVSRLGEEDLVYNYFFASQRESHSVPDMDFFAILSLILSHLDLSRIELPKLTSSILTKIMTIVLIDQFYFYIHQPIKSWLYKKVIFELDYY